MQYYYLNKIAMAVLVALLLFFGTRTLIDLAYEEHEPEKPGYEVAGADGEEHGKKEKPADEGAAFIAALNKADPAKGEQGVGLCKVCHSFDKDGPTMIGPNLYGVVGHRIAALEGFNYSPALRKYEDQEWTFENLDKWLANPQAFAPGTSMAFPGIADIQKRADVVAYLNKNSDDPLPIPEPAAEEAAPEEAADAGEGEAAGQPEIIALLASADAGKGEQGAALCKVCHTFDAGGATLIGPNLHNMVGADIAAHEDFNYSPALKGKEGDWTYEQLDVWLTNPQAFAPGTSMAFPGIPDAKKRADVIAFLMSMTENPPPLPAAEEEAAPAEDEAMPAESEEAAPAEEEAAPAEEEAAPTEEPAAEEAAPEEAADAGEGEAAGQPEIIALLASADAGKGEQGAALCKVCHTFDAGGATLIGPNLHNMVGADIAAHEDFNYSPALKGKEGDWTYEQLDVWLTNPQAFAPGTSMAFPGIPDAKKRADVIAFLMSMTENPPPLPAAEEEAAPAEDEAMPAESEEAAPAEEEAAPAEEEAAPTEEPAAEEPAAEEPADEETAEEEAPLAAEPEAPSATDEPAADEVIEEGREEIIVNSPTVSEDAPSEPSKGEPPSASQPQPVVPNDADSGMAAEPEPSATDEPPADEVMEEGREEIIDDAPASSSQPQPVYPDGEPEMDAESDSKDSSAPSGGDTLSSQPQPVYPDGKPEGL